MNEAVPTLTTRCAHWGHEEHRFWGHAVSSELVGEVSLIELAMLAVLGRRLPKEDCAILEDASAALTLADPRIWPLKLTRLVAAYGSAGPAAAAGMMILDDARIGPSPCAHAARDLVRLRSRIGDALTDRTRVREVVESHLRERGIVCGFGTPFRARDERLVAFRRSMELRRRDTGDYWVAMDAVAEAVRHIKKIEPNIGLGLAAACLDLGLSPSEIGSVATMLSQHMFWANAIEGAAQAPSVLRELPREAVSYVGRPRRALPNRPIASMVVPKSQAAVSSESLNAKVG